MQTRLVQFTGNFVPLNDLIMPLLMIKTLCNIFISAQAFFIHSFFIRLQLSEEGMRKKLNFKLFFSFSFFMATKDKA
jgi:hypothetical protein